MLLKKLIKNEDRYWIFGIALIAVMLLLFWIFNFQQISINKFEYSVLVNFLSIVVIVSACFSIYLFMVKKIAIHKIFLSMILPLGLVYTITVPPGLVPDEWVHIENCLSLSGKILGKETTGLARFRTDEIELLSYNTAYPNKDYYEYTYDNLISISNNEYKEIKDKNSTSITLLTAYFPAVIGVSIARIIGLGAVMTCYLGRIFNFLFYTYFTYKAFEKLPFGKYVLFAVVLLPMALQQMFSLSYDTLINSCSFFCIAQGLEYVSKSCKNINRKEIFLYLFAAMVLIANKGSIYALILLIPIFSIYRNRENSFLIKQRAVFLITIVVIALILKLYPKFITETRVINNSENIVTLIPGIPSYSLSYLVSNIKFTISLLFNTVAVKGMWYISSTIGSDLSWLTVQLPMWIVNTWIVTLLMSVFTEKTGIKKFNIYNRLFYFGIGIVVMIGVMLAMATSFTPNTYPYIEGVQGRYFIPIIFLLLIVFQNNKVFFKDKMNKIFIVALLVISSISTMYVLNGFFNLLK